MLLLLPVSAMTSLLKPVGSMWTQGPVDRRCGWGLVGRACVGSGPFRSSQVGAGGPRL